MTDEELIARLRSMHWCVTTKANGVGVSDKAVAPEAADRIEELSKERDQHWDSFVHWRKEADDRSEQLAAARQDAKEAEAYAEELEANLARAVEALTPSGDTKAEYMGEFSFSQTMIGEDGDDVTVKTYVPWDTIKEIMAAILARATLAEIKGESHDPL